MKNIYNSLIAICIITSFVSCNDELTQEPIGLLTLDQIDTTPTITTLESSVSSSYQLLASTLNLIGEWGWDDGTVLRNDFILQDIASNDMIKKWNPDGDQAWMDEFSAFSFTADNGGFNGLWLYDYEGINRINLAISYLTNAEITQEVGIADARKNQLLGEAYFLRAFYYFDLVNNFGDVPLLTTPLKSFEEAFDVAVRVPSTEIWKQINSDLSEAKLLLPNLKYPSPSEPWRVSKGAVIALQAKVALYNEDWATVISLVNELDTLGFYSLNANYFDSFDVNKEFSENEVIFAYDHVSDQNPRKGNGLCALIGWGFIAPSADFINAFEPNDPRLLYTVDVTNQNVSKLLGNTVGDFKGNDDAPSNKIYIRYADVLLWKAEALNETEDYSGAIAIINQVRTRARTTATADGSVIPLGTLTDRPSSTDPAQIKGWLMSERRVELGFESQRFNDLKRWGTAKSVLTGLGKNFQDKNYLYPIPQGDVDKSGGTITQNLGY
ncbi:RagB/SusD family nutrient uptake outer membrane protein [Mariniflexile litorale]|uniref:RagB/SusD family nutrient uptake outer membrane protein n=1 Tax=Mariniflexile litorale TaxID=3045158 RepID=A0AAU7EIL5_9FLAO|nr:RagB/SusD family nutrient uptake outer membrane protein [Mariniflexile sp. KMM 9835]MDQ8210199.1 RagB/SusD family nutrient uptake outer membrane protein [Mariniflexile sp. KMM 9835]